MIHLLFWLVPMVLIFRAIDIGNDCEPKQNDSDIYSEQFYANEWIEE